MPNLDRHKLVEIAGRAQVDPRTAVLAYAKLQRGEIPPVVRLALELQRMGIEVVPASASGAK
jgi:hypothetical protein